MKGFFISQHLYVQRTVTYKRDMDPALREPTVSWEETGVNLTIAQMYNYKLWSLVKKN